MVLASRAGLIPSEFPLKLKLLRLTVPPSPVIKLPEPPLELTHPIQYFQIHSYQLIYYQKLSKWVH